LQSVERTVQLIVMRKRMPVCRHHVPATEPAGGF